MRAVRLLGLAAISLCCLSADAYAQIRFCDWPASGKVPARHNQNNIVEWGSIADEAGPDLLNISNYVINLDPAGSRNIDWDTGSMRVEALRPDHVAYVCQERSLGRIDRDGPLYFARDRSSMSTNVYAGRVATEREFIAGTPLNLKTEFTVSGKSKGGTVALSVRVVTTLVKTDSGYSITYTLTNLSPSDAVVDFPIDPAMLKDSDGGRVTLKKGDTRTVTATTQQFPAGIRFPVRIQERDPKGTSAIVMVPTMRTRPPGR
jgi:hypothetical protein